MSLTENFAIVVVGGMNPRIHHPLFYKMLELAPEQEIQAALDSDSTICVPQTAQLDLGDVRVVCLPDRWQISSTNEAACPRLLSVADRVMSALDFTPVSAVGFNFDFVRSAGAKLADRLAALSRTMPLAFPPGPGASAAFTYSTVEAETAAKLTRRVTIQLGADGPGRLFARQNFHYDIHIVGHFSVGEIMRARHERDRSAAQAQLARTLDAIKEP